MKIEYVAKELYSWLNEDSISQESVIFIKKGSQEETTGELFVVNRWCDLNFSTLADEYKIFFKDVRLSKDCRALRILGPHGRGDETFDIKIRTIKFGGKKFEQIKKDPEWVEFTF